MTQNLPYGFEISEEYPTPNPYGFDAVYYLSYRGEGVGVYYTRKAAEAAAACGCDPTPWCNSCGSMTKRGCDCGPIADNN